MTRMTMWEALDRTARRNGCLLLASVQAGRIVSAVARQDDHARILSLYTGHPARTPEHQAVWHLERLTAGHWAWPTADEAGA